VGEDLIGFSGPDGLALSARRWPGPAAESPVVLCLHGLTRNSRDFQPLAAALADRFTVLAPDQRGRGRSAYDPNVLNYNVVTQTADVWALLDHLGIATCTVIGTSMGALMAVIMANGQPGRLQGVVLNDAGPVVEAAGLARIAGYVGQGLAVQTWEDAAAALQAVQGLAYPDYRQGDWLRMARATYVERPEGGLVLDYDADLRKVFAEANGAAPDLWPAFEALKAIPTLVLRGAHSDILAAETAGQMAERLGAQVVTIPNRGHAPDLSEPQALQAIEGFLASPALTARRLTRPRRP
jgi:pimeloyl-ACP methyl ester carboxylesterase